MKPKWVARQKAGCSPIHNIDFYVPDEEYQILLKAKGKKLSWREFILEAAKSKIHSQRLRKGKGDT